MIRNPRELQRLTRRHFFEQSALGIGALALSSLLDEELFAASPQAPHFAPKAKQVIYLFMAGAPSQLDLFDNKPTLNRYDGQPAPDEVVKGERFAFIKGTPRLLGSPHTFARHGRSGTELSNLLPHLAGIVDDIAIVKSMHTTQFNHAPGQVFMNTGHQILGRPSMGSWLTYGLGSESRDLPGFVVLLSGTSQPDGGKSCWGNGFLPTEYQGVEFRSKGDPVLYLSNPDGVAPPHTYGMPRNWYASDTAWPPSVFVGTFGSGMSRSTNGGTPESDACAAGICARPSTAEALLTATAGCAARASPTRSCVPGARPSDGSETNARSATRPEPSRPGDTASCSATT